MLCSLSLFSIFPISPPPNRPPATLVPCLYLSRSMSLCHLPNAPYNPIVHFSRPQQNNNNNKSNPVLFDANRLSKVHTERHSHQSVAAQVLCAVRRRFRLLLDGGRQRVRQAAPSVARPTAQVRAICRRRRSGR